MFGIKPVKIGFNTYSSLGLPGTLKVYQKASLIPVPSRVLSREIVDAHSYDRFVNKAHRNSNTKYSFTEERLFKNRDVVANYEIDKNNNTILRRLNVWLKDGRRRNNYTLNYDKQGSLVEMIRHRADGTTQTYKKGADGKFIRPAIMA